MPTQMKLADILNILSIGILFQVIISFFFYCIDKENTITNFEKIDGAVLTGLAIILSFPSWRIVSIFVEYIMYPQRKISQLKLISFENQTIFKKILIIIKNFKLIILFPLLVLLNLIKRYYRYIFFGVKPDDGIDGKAFINSLRNSDSEVNKLAIENIKKLFNINVNSLREWEYSSVFNLVKSYLTMSERNSSMFSHRYSMVLNYHVRLAILSNFTTLGSFIILLYNFLDFKYAENIIVNVCYEKLTYILVVSILISRHFGSLSKTYALRENVLLTNDLNAICSFSENNHS